MQQQRAPVNEPSSLQTLPPVYVGWSDRMAKHVTPGVGAWTTDMTKLASLSCMQQLLMEGRFTVATGWLSPTVNQSIGEPRHQTQRQ